MAFAGLISGYIIALHLQDNEGYILWEIKLPDAPLRLLCADGRLFAALANGTLTVLENITEWSPTSLELLHIPLGPAPLVDVILNEQEICIATACKLIHVDASTLTTVSTTYVACSSAGASTPFFEKISCLAVSPLGIFLCTANSTLLQLWSHGDCQLLFDVAFDHRRRSSGSVSEDGNCFFVSSLTYFDDMVWTGTSDGYVILYSIGRNAKRNVPKYSLKKYPTGCRLSPEGACGVVNRSQMCYIPTDEEARGEEIMSLAEGVRRPSRVSISIDVGTQQYIVCRKSLERKEEGSHECDGLDNCSGHDGCLKRRKDTSIGKIPERPPLNLQRFSSCSSRDHSAPSFDHNAFSINSDTSAFTIESTGSRKKLSRRIRETKGINPARCCIHFLIITTVNAQPMRERRFVRSPIASSSNVSMEYDDLFEMYSDEDYSQDYLLNPITAISSTTKLGSECSCSCVNPLRRKDLEFDDPVVLAIPESVKEKHKIASPSFERNDSILHEEFQEVNSSFGLTVVMKLKIADKPVKKMATTRIGDDDMLLTCAGSFSEEESLLLWRKEPISGLWINDPIPPLPVRNQT